MSGDAISFSEKLIYNLIESLSFEKHCGAVQSFAVISKNLIVSHKVNHRTFESSFSDVPFTVPFNAVKKN